MLFSSFFLNILQLVFGLTYSNLSFYLRFGICLMVETFRDNLLAQVSLPLAEEINKYKAAFRALHQLLHDFLGNNGWIEAVLIAVRQCRDPREFLQWMDPQPLRNFCDWFMS
jgi:hypothetical protein